MAKLLSQAITEGKKYPWWMGYAWFNYERNYAIFLPVPINIFMQFLRWLYYNLRKPRMTKIDVIIRDKLKREYMEGRAMGIAIGRSQVYDDIASAVNKVTETSDGESK